MLAVAVVALACSEPESFGSEATIDEVLEPAELLARFPSDPADGVGETLIEGALSLAVAEDFVYVLDAVASSVLRIDLEGRLLARAGRKGEGPGELSSPISVATGTGGELWVSDPAAGRLSRYSPEGEPLGDYSTAYPAVNFGLTVTGVPIVPTLDARTLFATVSSDGSTDLPVDPAVVPARISAGPRDRISFRGLLLAGLDDGSVAMLQNRHGTTFALWKVHFDAEVSSIVDVRPLPIPRWLYTILDEETERVRRTLPEEFATGDFLTPFKGMHAVGGRLWLTPTPSSRLVVMSVPTPADDRLSVVVGERGVYEGLIDAAVVGGRLVALYRTEVRVYRLEAAPPGRFVLPR